MGTKKIFAEVARLGSVQRCINKTVGAITGRWRNYDTWENIRARCLFAIYELLQDKNEFDSEEELVFYLFGNQYRKSLVYWHVEGQLKSDAGIKSFNGPLHLELDSCKEGDIIFGRFDRTRIIHRIEELFNRKDILSELEKAVLALSYNLSVMEENREDDDKTAWSTEEIAQVIGVEEKEIQNIRRGALLKLKPHLMDL